MNLTRSYVALLASTLAFTFASQVAHAADSVADKNTKTVLAFLDMVFNQHKVKEAFAAYVGPTYKQHQPKVGDGIEAGIKGLTFVTTQKYPNLSLQVVRHAAEGNLVFAHIHQFRDDGDKQTGLGLAIVDIFRLENGKIVEHWDVVEDVADPATAANQNGMF